MYTSILFQFALLPFLALAQGTATQAAGPQETGPKLFNGGEDNPVDPSTAGAEGSSKGAFSLSRGAIAAIITVAVLVAVGGTVSAILFWLAKKRQWDVRQSLRRASRRLTGRGGKDDSSSNKRQNRRTGVRLNSPPPSKKVANKPQKEKDLEKGTPASGETGKTTTTITSTFDIDTPTPKGAWTVFGGKK